MLYYKCWTVGKYADLWTLNHFLAGALLGAYGRWLSLDPVFWFGISLLMMLGWEVYELCKDLPESWYNRTIDVVLEIASYFLLYMGIAGLEPRRQAAVFVVLFVTWLGLELWGFFSFKHIYPKS